MVKKSIIYKVIKMKTMEKLIDILCQEYNEAELEYSINSGIFYYDMHNDYSNEIRITFPKNSNQLHKFVDDLYMAYENDNRYNYKEIYGEEVGDKVDTLLIWWRN